MSNPNEGLGCKKCGEIRLDIGTDGLCAWCSKVEATNRVHWTEPCAEELRNTKFKRHNTIQSLQGVCLHNVLVQLDILKCGGASSSSREKRPCIDIPQLLLEDYCPRCAAMYWARRGLEE